MHRVKSTGWGIRALRTQPVAGRCVSKSQIHPVPCVVDAPSLQRAPKEPRHLSACVAYQASGGAGTHPTWRQWAFLKKAPRPSCCASRCLQPVNKNELTPSTMFDQFLPFKGRQDPHAIAGEYKTTMPEHRTQYYMYLTTSQRHITPTMNDAQWPIRQNR